MKITLGLVTTSCATIAGEMNVVAVKIVTNLSTAAKQLWKTDILFVVPAMITNIFIAPIVICCYIKMIFTLIMKSTYVMIAMKRKIILSMNMVISLNLYFMAKVNDFSV